MKGPPRWIETASRTFCDDAAICFHDNFGRNPDLHEFHENGAWELKRRLPPHSYFLNSYIFCLIILIFFFENFFASAYSIYFLFIFFFLPSI